MLFNFHYGYFLKSIRNDRKLTVDAVCGKTGLNRAVISSLENEKREISPALFQNYCSSIGIPFESDVPAAEKIFQQLQQFVILQTHGDLQRGRQVLSEILRQDQPGKFSESYFMLLLCRFIDASLNLKEKEADQWARKIEFVSRAFSNDEYALFTFFKGFLQFKQRVVIEENPSLLFKEAVQIQNGQQFPSLKYLCLYYNLRCFYCSSSAFEQLNYSEMLLDYFSQETCISRIYDVKCLQIVYFGRIGCYEKAEELARSVLNFSDNYPEWSWSILALENLAWVYMLKKDFRKALDLLSDPRITPENASGVYMYKPFCYIMLDDTFLASQTLKESFEICTDPVEMRFLECIDDFLEGRSKTFERRSFSLLQAAQKARFTEVYRWTLYLLIKYYQSTESLKELNTVQNLLIQNLEKPF